MAVDPWTGNAMDRWAANVQPHVPWCPAPNFVAVQGGSYRCVGYNPATNTWDITVPAGPNVHQDGVIEHESGHHVNLWTEKQRGWLWPDFLVEWITAMGAAWAYRYPTPDCQERFAEHFRELCAPGSPKQYPLFWGQVPYNAAIEQNYLDSIACEEDGLKFISGVVVVQTNAQGNGQAAVNPTGLRQGVDAFGSAQRIGFAGSEPDIGRTTYIVDTSQAVALGTLHVRKDLPNATTYWRVMAEQ